MAEKEKVRIQKYLSSNGVASRRKAEKMILDGLISVNGKAARIGDKINPYIDKVFVNNERIIPKKQEKTYIMLNKPRGYITTLHDEKDRKCVSQLVQDIKERIYPVGRLDRNSEGLLIMTNDGEFANMIMHPSNHVKKTYRVTLRSNLNDYQIANLCSGVDIGDYKTSPARVWVVAEEKGRTVIEITIGEGKNRQIRRMCECLGLDVARLKRIAVGDVKLGGLPVGKWRNLSREEIKKLLPKDEIK